MYCKAVLGRLQKSPCYAAVFNCFHNHSHQSQLLCAIVWTSSLRVWEAFFPAPGLCWNPRAHARTCRLSSPAAWHYQFIPLNWGSKAYQWLILDPLLSSFHRTITSDVTLFSLNLHCQVHFWSVIFLAKDFKAVIRDHNCLCSENILELDVGRKKKRGGEMWKLHV